MTLRERLKAVTNNFAWEQDWNIQEYAVHKRDIDYRRGKADAYGDVVHRLDEVLKEFPEEPVVKDKMTLTELAHKLRKIFKFKYLTVDDSRCIYAWRGKKPRYLEKEEYWTGNCSEISIVLETWAHEVDLNLSEYADENGEIDYSRCIVEVSNDAE